MKDNLIILGDDGLLFVKGGGASQITQLSNGEEVGGDVREQVTLDGLGREVGEGEGAFVGAGDGVAIGDSNGDGLCCRFGVCVGAIHLEESTCGACVK